MLGNEPGFSFAKATHPRIANANEVEFAGGVVYEAQTPDSATRTFQVLMKPQYYTRHVGSPIAGQKIVNDQSQLMRLDPMAQHVDNGYEQAILKRPDHYRVTTHPFSRARANQAGILHLFFHA
jgi:hypothetical protein